MTGSTISKYAIALMMAMTCFQFTYAGDFAPPAGEEGSTAVPISDPGIIGWATGVSQLIRGPMDIASPQLGLASFGESSLALGPASGSSFDVVSLGDGGSITLTFNQPVANGPGYDLAVFENGFSDSFLELAFVEVSSDGQNFIRFNAISQTQTAAQVGGFGTLDTTNLHNLAGKYRMGFGTPFDLAELAGMNPLVDVTAITHVRIIDVVGSIDPACATLDSLGNIINDPYATPFNTGGFDLDAVAVLAINLMPGDANMDEKVDLLDLTTLGENYGMTKQAIWQQGDFNGDGAVDLLDLTTLGENYSSQSMAAVPEPSCLWLLTALGLTTITRRTNSSR